MYLLDILVENMGRSNILPVMDTQRKGLANAECYLLFFSIFTFVITQATLCVGHHSGTKKEI